ncbi:metal ABC transporter substrate-binding protein [Ammoniphilus oxalaticus]|uniref:Metal ABC transporter substrate-binding protein n=1 Tax=Ammoniphilus oxalaticus TaxID=66863 RepID=A0A419SKJ0_9BACL|nr:ABC transporter substrate-binding protein [Ammoniphilus oxalaticus]RKD24446.1 metal ABC transporter substrate-binding protein [Ammoniphilus oxalaticus]
MKKIIQRISLLFIIMAMAVISACGNTGVDSSNLSEGDAKRTVKIGYLPITHAVPLYIEKELEGYSHFDLELVKFGAWPDLIDALNTGSIDGASMLVTLAMKAKEQGIDLKAVALGHKDGNVLVVGNDIENVADLKGKNFAIPHKFSSHNILLYQMLKQNGMTYDDITLIELPPAEMPAALSEGRIAGYVVAEPFGAISVAIERGKVLYQDYDVWENSIDCMLVLRNDFIDNEFEIAQEFVDYYLKAGEVAEKKDEDTFEMSSRYMSVEKDVLDLSFQWIRYDDLKITEEDYAELVDYLIEMKLQEHPPTFEEFVDNRLIDQVK